MNIQIVSAEGSILRQVFAQTAWNLEMSPLEVVFVSVCVEVASSSWNTTDCFLCLNYFDSSVHADKKIIK